MDVTPAGIAQILTQLGETPRRIALLTGGLDDSQLRASPEQDSWSQQAILAHLRSCADVWGKSIQEMLAEDNPSLRYVSPRTWMRKTNYLEQAFDISFQAFEQQRADLLAVLQSLASDDWSRAATFSGTTKGRSQTVFSYAQRIAEHERQHLEQIEGIVAAFQAVSKAHSR